jgi:hypothetical protein
MRNIFASPADVAALIAFVYEKVVSSVSGATALLVLGSKSRNMKDFAERKELEKRSPLHFPFLGKSISNRPPIGDIQR